MWFDGNLNFPGHACLKVQLSGKSKHCMSIGEGAVCTCAGGCQSHVFINLETDLLNINLPSSKAVTSR